VSFGLCSYDVPHWILGEPLMTEDTINYVIDKVRAEGSGCWWTSPLEELLPPQLRSQAGSYRRGEDTMDVWFDSGCSWAGVLHGRESEGLNFPADLYLEGSDQHRGEYQKIDYQLLIISSIMTTLSFSDDRIINVGWFQSSLLTCVAANGVAPYRQVRNDKKN